MLKYEHNKDIDRLEFEGSLADIIAESTFMFRRIYERLAIKDPSAAETFRDHVVRITREDGPCWENVDSMKEKLLKKLEELADLLKSREET